MKVEIILTANEMKDFELQGKTAVVIDTLRATSTIIAALSNGAKAVEPKADIESALERGQTFSAGDFLLGGERDSVKVKGFHLGNSPLEYRPEVVEGKTMILSTTNGTRAIYHAMEAKDVLIAAMLNVSVTGAEVMRLKNDLVLCCSGTKGHFSLEDFVTAGAIIGYLKEQGVEVEGDDRVQTAWLLYDRNKDELVELMSCSQNGIRLVDIGMVSDIEFCAMKDHLPVLCRFDGERVIS